MSPVDDAAFIIGDKDALKVDDAAEGEAVDTVGEVDVMGDQYGLARFETQDKALMATTVIVVGQDADDRTMAADGVIVDQRALWLEDGGVGGGNGECCRR